MSNVTTYVLTNRIEGPGPVGVLNNRIQAWRRARYGANEDAGGFVEIDIRTPPLGPKYPEMDMYMLVTNYELELMSLIPEWIRTIPWDFPEEVVLTIYSEERAPIIAMAQ